jgi:hypothetical protein
MVSLAFALLTLLHELFFQDMGGRLYFLSVLLIDLSIMEIILRLENTAKLTVKLLKICFCFILLNVWAWVMWEMGVSLFFYEPGAAILYLYTIVSLLSWDGIENGNYNIGRRDNILRLYNYSGIYHSGKIPGKG